MSGVPCEITYYCRWDEPETPGYPYLRFGYVPMFFGELGQVAPIVKRPEKSPIDLLTVPEVAAQIGVTEDTIRKWARSGKITSVRLSKVDVRFRQTDLNEFVSSRLSKRKSAFK
jgi:excisionase family DNA binding protein